MKEFVVKYTRKPSEIEIETFGNKDVIDSKWFSKYETALKFAEKHQTKVYNGYDLITENVKNLRGE